MKKLPTAEETALAFLINVFKNYGMPQEIISDRGPQFNSRFWKRLFQLCGVKTKLSSSFHPETDGQTERVNQTLEQYIRCFTNYRQNNWSDLLHLAEFSYNNAIHSSTKLSPFKSLMGYNPRLEISKVNNSVIPKAEDRIKEIEEIHKVLSRNIDKAINKYKSFEDRNRIKGPNFVVGDLVWLNSKNIKTTRPNKKLDYKFLGPFEIIKRINPVAFKLKLPETMNIHPVFHLSLLEKFDGNKQTDTRTERMPVVVNYENEYEVNEILDSRIYKKKLYYLIDWKGFDIGERSWEPARNLNCSEIVKDFHLKNPDKPRIAKI